jgi:hypothetical protein
VFTLFLISWFIFLFQKFSFASSVYLFHIFHVSHHFSFLKI